MERLKEQWKLILFCTLFFIAYLFGPNGAYGEENFDITTVSAIVNWYDSEAELMEAVGDYSAAGWSQCEYRPEFNISFCEFWLVRPKLQYADIDYVCIESDGYNFDTIGHEFYHAFIGDFHE